MLRWSLILLVVALAAAVLGIGAISGTGMDKARILFLAFLVLLVASAVVGAFCGRPRA